MNDEIKEILDELNVAGISNEQYNKLKNYVEDLESRIINASRKIDKFKETYIICFDKPLWEFVQRLEKCLKGGDK